MASNRYTTLKSTIYNPLTLDELMVVPKIRAEAVAQTEDYLGKLEDLGNFKVGYINDSAGADAINQYRDDLSNKVNNIREKLLSNPNSIASVLSDAQKINKDVLHQVSQEGLLGFNKSQYGEALQNVAELKAMYASGKLSKDRYELGLGRALSQYRGLKDPMAKYNGYTPAPEVDYQNKALEYASKIPVQQFGNVIGKDLEWLKDDPEFQKLIRGKRLGENVTNSNGITLKNTLAIALTSEEKIQLMTYAYLKNEADVNSFLDDSQDLGLLDKEKSIFDAARVAAKTFGGVRSIVKDQDFKYDAGLDQRIVRESTSRKTGHYTEPDPKVPVVINSSPALGKPVQSNRVEIINKNWLSANNGKAINEKKQSNSKIIERIKYRDDYIQKNSKSGMTLGGKVPLSTELINSPNGIRNGNVDKEKQSFYNTLMRDVLHNKNLLDPYYKKIASSIKLNTKNGNYYSTNTDVSFGDIILAHNKLFPSSLAVEMNQYNTDYDNIVSLNDRFNIGDLVASKNAYIHSEKNRVEDHVDYSNFVYSDIMLKHQINNVKTLNPNSKVEKLVGDKWVSSPISFANIQKYLNSDKVNDGGISAVSFEHDSQGGYEVMKAGGQTFRIPTHSQDDKGSKSTANAVIGTKEAQALSKRIQTTTNRVLTPQVNNYSVTENGVTYRIYFDFNNYDNNLKTPENVFLVPAHRYNKNGFNKESNSNGVIENGLIPVVIINNKITPITQLSDDDIKMWGLEFSSYSNNRNESFISEDRLPDVMGQIWYGFNSQENK